MAPSRQDKPLADRVRTWCEYILTASAVLTVLFGPAWAMSQRVLRLEYQLQAAQAQLAEVRAAWLQLMIQAARHEQELQDSRRGR